MTEIGDTQQLTVTFDPAEMNSSGIIWTSDKPSVASVNANGLVTAIGPGEATINAKSKVGAKTASCVVTVIAGLEAGLYQNDVLIDLSGVTGDNLLAKSFNWIKDNVTIEDDEYKILLDEDITVTNGFSIGTGPTGSSTGNDASKNKNITIRLQGLTTVRTIITDNTGALFTVYGANANDVPHLILGENITLQGNNNNNNSSALVMIGKGTSNMGKLTMENGSRITGHTSTGANGGGVYIYAGSTFEMKKGTIDLNKSTATAGKGGGIYLAGTLIMHDGSVIEKNEIGTTTSTSGVQGAGVWMGGNATFNMDGGIIRNNKCISTTTTSAVGGGGVYATKFTMSGGSILNNEALNGGGVMIASSKNNFFHMEGGVIAGNRAVSMGAAVLRYNAGAFEKTGGIIYGTDDAEENANKKTDEVSGIVHSIEMGNSNGAYYDGTAGTGVTLKHGSENGYTNVGNWIN
jgi:hypothetical protein